MRRAPLPKSRVLVLIGDEICGRCLARALADRGEGAAGTFVVIIALALVHSATAAWTDDIDATNPSRAIEDGLSEFAPNRVMVATHPADRMGLLERELLDRLAHDGTGVTRVVMAPDGYSPLTPRGGYAAGRTPKSGLQADDRRVIATQHR